MWLAKFLGALIVVTCPFSTRYMLEVHQTPLHVPLTRGWYGMQCIIILELHMGYERCRSEGPWINFGQLGFFNIR